MKNHYYLFLLFSISVFTHAQELDFIQYSDISSIPQIVLNPKIQTELQTLLKHDYLKFQSNFDNYSAPYLLKTDEALCIMKVGLEQFRCFIRDCFKDGRLFAAIYFSNQDLKYFSNDASCSEQLHPAIQVFAQQREIQSIEYATARVNTALKYNLVCFLNVRHIKKKEEANFND
jgi:hypothetical protein